MSLNKPIKVKLNDNFDREFLSLSRRDWLDNNNKELPRSGIVRKDKEYTVEADDGIVQHYLDGNTLVRLDVDDTSFEDKLDKLPFIGKERAENIMDDFKTFEEFKNQKDLIGYLSDIEGIGTSRAEKIMEEIK